MSVYHQGVKVTKTKGFCPFNLVGKWKRTYRGWASEEAWFILTNLSSMAEALEAYQKRMGIEEMFRDFKSGGYNLEGTQVIPIGFELGTKERRYGRYSDRPGGSQHETLLFSRAIAPQNRFLRDNAIASLYDLATPRIARNPAVFEGDRAAKRLTFGNLIMERVDNHDC